MTFFKEAEPNERTLVLFFSTTGALIVLIMLFYLASSILNIIRKLLLGEPDYRVRTVEIDRFEKLWIKQHTNQSITSSTEISVESENEVYLICRILSGKEFLISITPDEIQEIIDGDKETIII